MNKRAYLDGYMTKQATTDPNEIFMISGKPTTREQYLKGPEIDPEYAALKGLQTPKARVAMGALAALLAGTAGAGVGAGMGALASSKGKRGKGALIGAGIGGGVGALAGGMAGGILPAGAAKAAQDAYLQSQGSDSRKLRLEKDKQIEKDITR